MSIESPPSALGRLNPRWRSYVKGYQDGAKDRAAMPCDWEQQLKDWLTEQIEQSRRFKLTAQGTGARAEMCGREEAFGECLAHLDWMS